MRKLKDRIRLFISILAISLWLGASSCDILMTILDEAAQTEQNDNTKKDTKSKTKTKTQTKTKDTSKSKTTMKKK